MKHTKLLLPFLLFGLLLAGCGTKNTDNSVQKKNSGSVNTDNAVQKENSESTNTDKPAQEKNNESTNTDKSAQEKNNESTKSDLISKDGVFNGQADPHTIEVTVDNKPIELQVKDELQSKLNSFSEGDKIHFEYSVNDKKQNELASIEKIK